MPALVPTCQMRFLRKEIATVTTSGGVQKQVSRILQQKWVVDLHQTEVLLHAPEQYDEWRDVPMVDAP